uniref:Uncharacterized protein n=1 Tax=Oryza glumipatula TaxID=40148 RepID=A0A0E0B3E1_9ORYZ
MHAHPQAVPKISDQDWGAWARVFPLGLLSQHLLYNAFNPWSKETYPVSADQASKNRSSSGFAKIGSSQIRYPGNKSRCKSIALAFACHDLKPYCCEIDMNES